MQGKPEAVAVAVVVGNDGDLVVAITVRICKTLVVAAVMVGSGGGDGYSGVVGVVVQAPDVQVRLCTWEQIRVDSMWAVYYTQRRLGVQQLSVGRATCCRSSSSASLASASSRFSSSARLHSSNHAKPSYSPPDDAPGV